VGSSTAARGAASQRSKLLLPLPPLLSLSARRRPPARLSPVEWVASGWRRLPSSVGSYDAASDADDDDGDSGRLNIGGDIRLDTLDIHTLNDSQSINAPPLLDDIEIVA
jgi:hypothetical protein